jgi:hypothetical protein
MGGIGHNSQRAQSIVRSNPEYGFTKISNAFLQDSRVSYETRGLLAELLSRPDDWEITIVNIVKSGPAGRDKVYRMMKEAEKFGYAVTRKDRGMDGAFRKHDYRVSDDPQLLIARVANELESLLPENPEVDEPDTVVPFPAKAEVVGRQSTSLKAVSGNPLPEKPYTAQPLPANPHHTNKRELQKKETTLESASALSRAAASVAIGIVATAGTMPAAATPIEPPAIVHPVCQEIPYEELKSKLMEAGGEAIGDAAGLEVLSAPRSWLRAGCDLAEDILPAIKARAAKMPRRSINSWNYFAQAVADAKAARTAPMPAGIARPKSQAATWHDEQEKLQQIWRELRGK